MRDNINQGHVNEMIDMYVYLVEDLSNTEYPYFFPNSCLSLSRITSVMDMHLLVWPYFHARLHNLAILER